MARIILKPLFLNSQKNVDKLVSNLNSLFAFPEWDATCKGDADCPNSGEMCVNPGTKTAKCSMYIYSNFTIPENRIRMYNY